MHQLWRAEEVMSFDFKAKATEAYFNSYENESAHYVEEALRAAFDAGKVSGLREAAFDLEDFFPRVVQQLNARADAIERGSDE
jgi:hypothetical protein